MEHNTCRENLSAYLDGELPAEEKLSLESHLALCPSCNRQLEELKLVSVILKKHAMKPVPPALKEEVFAEKPAAPVFSGWFKPVLTLSAAAVGLLIIFGLPKFRDREQSYSPAFLSNSSMDQSALGARSAGPASSSSGEISGDGVFAMSVSSLRSPAPFLSKGAYGQAKFASRGSSAGGGAAYSSVDSLVKVSSGSMLAAAAGDKKMGSFSANAGETTARPEWLAAMIRRLQAGERGTPPFKAWRYSYKGNEVYYLPPQCCDQYSELYDEAGKLLCAPDGGKTGLGDGRCADFNKFKKAGELIWQDPRK